MNKRQIHQIRSIIRRVLKENWMRDAGLITRSEDIYTAKLNTKLAAEELGIKLTPVRSKAYSNILNIVPGLNYSDVAGQLTFTQESEDSGEVHVALDMDNSDEDGYYLTDSFHIDTANLNSMNRDIRSLVSQLKKHCDSITLL